VVAVWEPRLLGQGCAAVHRASSSAAQCHASETSAVPSASPPGCHAGTHPSCITTHSISHLHKKLATWSHVAAKKTKIIKVQVTSFYVTIIKH